MNNAPHDVRIRAREAVCKARNDFSRLDNYSRDQIAVLGTGFTAYEDKGDLYCRELNRLAVEWRKAADLAEATANIQAMMRDGVRI